MPTTRDLASRSAELADRTGKLFPHVVREVVVGAYGPDLGRGDLDAAFKEVISECARRGGAASAKSRRRRAAMREVLKSIRLEEDAEMWCQANYHVLTPDGEDPLDTPPSQPRRQRTRKRGN